MPNHESSGVHCYEGAPNPNMPAGHHIGSCGCENTQVRVDGKLYMMESSAHGCDEVMPGYNTTAEGDCTYFRLRDMETGWVFDIPFMI